MVLRRVSNFDSSWMILTQVSREEDFMASRMILTRVGQFLGESGNFKAAIWMRVGQFQHWGENCGFWRSRCEPVAKKIAEKIVEKVAILT